MGHKGWSIELSEDNSKVRRSRRAAATESVSIKRDSDGLVIRPSDTVLVQSGSETEIALIKEISFGTNALVDVKVLWFLRGAEIDANLVESVQPHELFITGYVEEFDLNSVIDKVSVVSEAEYDPVMSQNTNCYMCTRGASSQGDVVTEKLDYRELMELFAKDPNELVDFIRTRTVTGAYKTKPAKVSVAEKLKQVEKVKKGKKKTPEPESENSSSDEYQDIEQSEEEDIDKDEIEEDEIEDPDVDMEPSTPRKRKNAASPKKTKSPRKISKSPAKNATDDENSPRKRFKSKPKVSVPSLASLSPRKPIPSTTSSSFKELKAKLHSSIKLNSLPGRENESMVILDKLYTAIKTEIGSCIYISGTPGIGKTATVRDVITQLKEFCSLENLKFDYCEINGLKLLSPNVAYEILWRKITGENISASNAAISLEEHFARKRDNDVPLVVLMDELDQIVTKNQNVMYNFFNWPSYTNSKLIVIAVANTMDLPERVLSNKISSRLGLNRVQFLGYTFDQLGDIIKHRLDMITSQNNRKVIMNPDAISFASRKVASVSGDARRALTICRRAVEIAESEYLAAKSDSNDEEGTESKDNEPKEVFYVQISHISKAINETVNSPTAQFLGSLPFAAKLLLKAILLRKKRTGMAENMLGDIIDEMKNSLHLLTSQKGANALNSLDPNVTLLDLLYSSSFLDPSSPRKLNIRATKFKQLINELVENGILMQQNVPGERCRLINLNVSEEELTDVLRKDRDILGEV